MTTRAPWHVHCAGGNALSVIGHDCKAVCEFPGGITAEPHRDPKEQGSNAFLIAAAPDLYAALKHIVDTLVYEDSDGMVTYSEQVINARAALAKARGEG